MTTTRRRTLWFILAALCLAVGTPAYLGLARPGMRTYLLQPMIFAVQSLPYLVAASVLLPPRSAGGRAIGQTLAALLFLAAVLLYVPMLAGLWGTSGDMVGLGFFMIDIVTTAALLLLALVAFGALWLRQRTHERSRPRPEA